MRSAELAIYADELAAEAAVLAARLERVRSALRQAAIEQEAVAALPGPVVGRLRALGLLTGAGPIEGAAELDRIGLDLQALLQLQAWVERQLKVGRDIQVTALREVPRPLRSGVCAVKGRMRSGLQLEAADVYATAGSPSPVPRAAR